MITCNRCGRISPDGAMNCRNCGAPLSSNAETGPGPSRSFQEQPELPAWLGSLRAGERPAAPADNPSNFSTADLIEEGSLPSWMRSGRSDMNDTGMSSPHLSLRPSSASGPNTDDSKGINAKSLIDERSLPSWMQENRQPSGPIPEGGITASSLVQQDFMPDWMKSLQQNQPVSNPTPSPARPQPPMSSAFPEQAAPSPMAGGANEFSSGPGQGFSARNLVDQQSLPSWMTQQEEKGSAPVQPPVPGTLSPSSLVDVNALPPWLRESSQQEQKSGGLPSSQANQSWQPMQPPTQGGAMQQGSPVWQPASPPMPPAPGVNNMPPQSEGLAASSFIDPNALPQWLRSGAEQQHQPPASPRSGYGVPPRVENVRVPSRPRGEINPNEGNAAAANVFASMLGVASTAPNYPGSPAAQGYGMQGGPSGQGVPASPMQGNMSGQLAGAPPGFTGPQAQGYAPGGFNSGVYQTGNPGQGNYPAGGPGNLGMETGSGQKTSTKPAKKGLFDMIRDWFR
ncbi:MAG: hypothetical protein JO011_05540 [Ktedonobacteraceae bacterium]|nr:hypothetical protein [Ktedonobacteraceae bacterium]